MKRQVVQTAGGKRAFWVCRTHLTNSSLCAQRKIREDDLQNTYITMLNKLCYSRGLLLLPYINAVTAEDERQMEHRLNTIQSRLQSIRKNRDDLVHRYSHGSLEAAAFFEKTAAFRREERELLREKRVAERFFGHTSYAQALDDFISDWKIGTERFPQDSFRALTDHILVNDRNQVTFVMKCGLHLSEVIGSVKKSDSGR